ncbi:MAG: 23S rRNA (guanosine(2251)-2'-O)-methyltransferase RlmB [Oscillospiraceae bacterium]|nr:23S rRNA (guanosine(2251)-2'-O)-methyltransferase RlmB [Oscillospiraceae bacterium]
MDPYHRRDDAEEEDAAGIIEGRNAVIEALRAGRAIDKIYLAKGETDGTLGHIAAKGRSAGAVVVEADRRKLDQMSRTKAHQGVIAVASVTEYATIPQILGAAESRREDPFVILCDEISDPHNLGAIIRTAEAAGAHGVIIPKRRSAGITPIVEKTSAGAVFHLPVARVPNLVSAIRELKEAGLWIYGSAADGTSPLWSTGFTGPAALVVGSEGSGMSRLVREACDFIVSIPMAGKVGSLNASVSAALLIYEVMRQRQAKND